LDSVFGSTGSAYTVGPMNRDHWLLYLTSPNAQPLLPSDASLTSSFQLSLPSPGLLSPPATPGGMYQDTTLEILMSYLSPEARAPFFQVDPQSGTSGHELGKTISRKIGIETLFPTSETVLDSFGFEPCGYSANAVIGSGSPHIQPSPGQGGGGYYTIHVTPEEGWSYASFECNVPLPFFTAPNTPSTPTTTPQPPNLPTLIRKVVDIFQPSRLSITLFVSTPTSSTSTLTDGSSNAEQSAWSAFGKDLLGKSGYERKDRIGYEFDGYDLVFACFEKRGWKEPQLGAGQAKLDMGSGLGMGSLVIKD